MLSIIFRALGLVFIVWLLQRVVGFFTGASKNRRAESTPAAPSNHMVKDPVCGMYMDSRLAFRLDKKSEEFYFCSEECKQKYLSGYSESKVAGSSAPR